MNIIFYTFINNINTINIFNSIINTFIQYNTIYKLIIYTNNFNNNTYKNITYKNIIYKYSISKIESFNNILNDNDNNYIYIEPNILFLDDIYKLINTISSINTIKCNTNFYIELKNMNIIFNNLISSEYLYIKRVLKEKNIMYLNDMYNNNNNENNNNSELDNIFFKNKFYSFDTYDKKNNIYKMNDLKINYINYFVYNISDFENYIEFIKYTNSKGIINNIYFYDLSIINNNITKLIKNNNIHIIKDIKDINKFIIVSNYAYEINIITLFNKLKIISINDENNNNNNNNNNNEFIKEYIDNEIDNPKYNFLYVNKTIDIYNKYNLDINKKYILIFIPTNEYCKKYNLSISFIKHIINLYINQEFKIILYNKSTFKFNNIHIENINIKNDIIWYELYSIMKYFICFEPNIYKLNINNLIMYNTYNLQYIKLYNNKCYKNLSYNELFKSIYSLIDI